MDELPWHTASFSPSEWGKKMEGGSGASETVVSTVCNCKKVNIRVSAYKLLIMGSRIFVFYGFKVFESNQKGER